MCNKKIKVCRRRSTTFHCIVNKGIVATSLEHQTSDFDNGVKDNNQTLCNGYYNIQIDTNLRQQSLNYIYNTIYILEHIQKCRRSLAERSGQPGVHM